MYIPHWDFILPRVFSTVMVMKHCNTQAEWSTACWVAFSTRLRVSLLRDITSTCVEPSPALSLSHALASDQTAADLVILLTSTGAAALGRTAGVGCEATQMSLLLVVLYCT